MKKIAYFIQTCDDYSKFWGGWYASYKKHWSKDLDWNVYFAEEELGTDWNDPTITEIKSFKTKKDWIPETREVDTHGNKLNTKGMLKQFDYGWSDRLIHALNQIEEEYILYVQEDMWLKRDIDPDFFQNCFHFVERNDLNVLHIHRMRGTGSHEYDQTHYFVNEHRVLKTKKDAGYLMSHQPAIWKKSFLLDVLEPGESFRDNEFDGTYRIRKYDDPKIYHINYDWCYGMPGAATAGNFFTFSFEDEWHQNVTDVMVDSELSLTREKYVPKSKGHKLSLVTSCFRAERFIDELAESVLSQSYDNWEWIVADDFSNDDTLAKLHLLQNRDPRIRLVYPKHKKEIWWNPQLHATGDIVCHIDSDDKLLPNTLEQINHYFNLFPEAVLMHFNANKYENAFPKDNVNIIDNYKNNVYMTRDNDSFLEGFSKLWPNRTNIFGYLRIFRNLPGLHFPEHEDGDACSSNDGQWLLTLERYGKWLTIPRTSYLAREHGDSENFRNWNPRGEAQLVINEKAIRKSFILEYPRNIKFFDDIYDAAESVYTSKVNYETEPKVLSFVNFDYTNEQKKKLELLFFDHSIVFDDLGNCDYFYVKINLDDNENTIEKIASKLVNKNEIIFYSDNVHLHQNNRNGFDNISNIKEKLVSLGFSFNWYIQDNRFYTVSHSRSLIDNVVDVKDIEVFEPIEVEKIQEKKEHLKIMQIHVGCGLEIPPKGYGGLEEVVYQYMRVAKKRGHEVSLKWLDDITQADLEEYDVFHNHTGGFHDLVKDRCIPYIFTMHDTWAKIHGKGSHFYNTNNETIKHSLFSLIPTEDMIDYFEHSHKLRRLHHGVDTNYFYPNDTRDNTIRLICVGGGDDRKGFHLAILAAHKLGLPITIVGPDSIHQNYNDLFYTIYNQCKNDIDIRLTGNLQKDELRKILNEHHIMIHPASIETGQPCLAVLEGMACGLPVVGTLQDQLEIPGFYQCTRDVQTIVDGVRSVLNDLDDNSKKAREFARERDWENIFDELEQYYWEAKELKYTKPFHMKDRLLFAYNETPIRKSKNNFNLTIKPNPYLQIYGPDATDYTVTFLNNETGQVFYSNVIGIGSWCASTISYYVPWKIIAKNNQTNQIEFEQVLDLKNKKVFIWFDSKAMGDNIAWMEPVEMFRLKHGCKVYCSTFYNEYFKSQYPEIDFIEPNFGFTDFDHQYQIGFFEAGDKSPVDCKEVPLQELAAKILGLDDYQERSSKILVREQETEIEGPYVAIATQSTAQAKYWNNSGAWEKVVDYLKSKSYNVVCVDQHHSFGNNDYVNTVPRNAILRQNRTLDQTIATINGAEFFIGLGSGLSWLAWALNKHVILISGFSHPKSEFITNCTRIFNDKVCNSCYNRHKFDPGDWLWCPDHKGTDRMFECTKNITPEEVFQAIDNVIDMRNNDFK